MANRLVIYPFQQPPKLLEVIAILLNLAFLETP